MPPMFVTTDATRRRVDRVCEKPFPLYPLQLCMPLVLNDGQDTIFRMLYFENKTLRPFCVYTTDFEYLILLFHNLIYFFLIGLVV